MKYLIYILLLVVLASSCKKETNVVKSVPISSVTIVNAVSSDAVIADLTGADSVAAFYYTSPQIAYGYFQAYSIPSGNTPVKIYNVADTIHPMFNSNLTLNNSAIYSLFLCGPSPAQTETLLTQDTIPYHSNTDSTMGIRFVNLSHGSLPISVNLLDNANGSEVLSLGYKAITGFKNYAANLNITGYVFEIRNAATGDLLTTTGDLLIRYDPNDGTGTFNLSPFRNITLALIGSPDPSSLTPLSIMLIKHY